MRVHVLTPGFTSPNGAAFLFPLVVWRRELEAADIHVRFFDKAVPALTDCDVAAIDSKFYSPRWAEDGDRVEAEIADLADRADKLLWFDITDGSGWDQARPLPYVTAWVKNQLLRDRSLYMRPIYGAGRLFAEFACERGVAEDASPEWSVPIEKPELLEKLRVGWNSALSDYSLFAPARMAVYRRRPLAGLLRFPRRWVDPASPRRIDVSCRFGIRYARQSVAWQRQEVHRRLGDRVPTDRLSRRRYFAEMAASKVVLSPFGWGEIAYRDYETFLSGALLMKPDMSHMETWPDLFRPEETIFVHSWDLSDFEEKLEAAIADDARRVEVAGRGQDLYRRYTVDRDAPDVFVRRLKSILDVSS